MSTTSPQTSPSRPQFATNSFADTESFLFYHTVDVQTWTLRIQVLGPNMTFTFHHRRMPGVLCASSLERKTVGFLALSRSAPSSSPSSVMSTPKRQIIAWAQSGHGMGSRGDSLMPGDFTLPNRYWAKRTIELAKILGVNAAHPWDQGHESGYDEARKGAYRAAHVEVKLAAHAVHTLLAVFNIQNEPRRVIRENLERLRTCRYQDGTAPIVEIFFSRKNCIPCGTFVQKLQAVTGVTFRLVWRHRLVRMQFKNEMERVGPQTNGEPIVIDDSDEEDEIFCDEAIDIDGPSDVEDLTPTDKSIEIEDGANDDEVVETARIFNLIDLTGTASKNVRQHKENDAVDAKLDSISYAIGQSQFRPDTARVAVLDLAHMVKQQNSSRTLDRTSMNRGRRAHRQHQAASTMNPRYRDRSVTPGRSPAHQLQRPSAGTAHPRGRSESPASIIEMLQDNSSSFHMERRRQRD